MNNRNRSNHSIISCTANQVKFLNERNRVVGNNRGKKKDDLSHPESNASGSTKRCENCKNSYHKSDACIKKQNQDLKATIDSLVKRVDAIGTAKMIRDESDESDFSGSCARLASLNTAMSAAPTQWNLDSACSNSLAPNASLLTDIQSSLLTLRTANNSKIHARTCQTVDVPIQGLENLAAHLIPNLAERLMFVSDLTDHNKCVLFLKHKALVLDNPSDVEEFCTNSTSILGTGTRVNQSYYLDDFGNVSFRTSQSSAASHLTWHFRLSHLNLRSLQELRRKGHIQVSSEDCEEVIRCADCINGKLSRLAMSSRQHHWVARKLERVHSDLCQLPSKSCNGYTYMMNFVDEFTHCGVVYFLESKHEAFSCFKNYVAYSERDTQIKLKSIRTDNREGYTSKDWAV